VQALSRTLSKIFRVLDVVGTFPRRDALVWSGTPSLLACLVFGGLFVARLASPLQWCKFWARRRASPRATDGPQQRADFHAVQTEIYFLIVLVGLFLVSPVVAERFTLPPAVPPALASMLHTGVRFAAALLLLEVFAWVLYYGSMRGFIEREYTIYHRAEYVLVLPLTFSVAVVAFSVFSGKAVLACAELLLDHPGSEFSPAEMMLGHASFLLFFAVTVTYLVAQFPPARIKSEDPADTAIAIVGAGDVVAARMLPALLESGTAPTSIIVLTRQISPTHEAAIMASVSRITGCTDDTDVGNEVQRSRAQTIIATPTLSHLPLFQAMLRANTHAEARTSRLRVAIEKPLVGPGQLATFRRVLGEYGAGNVFALSYYYLEKCLPLVYFLTHERSYLPYLCYGAKDEPAIDHAAVMCEKAKDLGLVRRITGVLLEGAQRSPAEDGRMWILDPMHGGIAYEMMVHLLMLSHVILVELAGIRDGVGALRDFDVTNAMAALCPAIVRIERWPTAVSVFGRAGDVDIDLVCGKYVAQHAQRRELTITLEHGTIHCDFDRQSVHVEGNSRKTTLQLRRRFADVSYSVQMDLVKSFFARGFWPWMRNDGLIPQLAALEWLETHEARLTDNSRLLAYDDNQMPDWMSGAHHHQRGRERRALSERKLP
jgi:hypothetical protein